ncbi:MAG: hypothetical protein ABN488_14880, partial [Methylobacteriaceae bacterium]
YLSRRAPSARRFLLGFEPGPTVIEQPVAAIGAQAMRPLYERIAHPGQPVRKVTLSGRAVRRGSS